MSQEARLYKFFNDRHEVARYIEQALLTTWRGDMERTSDEIERRNIRLRIADLERYFAEAMQPEADEGWWTIEQAAAHLGTTPKAVYKWAKIHGCPAYRVGLGLRTALRFRRSELDQWLSEQQVAPRVTVTLSQRSLRRCNKFPVKKEPG
jgi:excisionase family DNA binding protein